MDTTNEILSKLTRIRDLPTLPLVAQKLNAVVYDPNADARKMAEIIEDDPAIMAKILKVVNSALYAGTEEVTKVQHAVARMGMMTVNNIAMSTSVFSAFESSGDDSFDRQDFWRHSICCGIATGVIFDKARAAVPQPYTKDMLHLAGLIHDMGKILLDQHFTEQFRESIALSKEEGIPLYKAEKKVMGTHHGQVGAWLGTQWKMSKQLVQVMRQHHEPEMDDPNYWGIAALSNVANYICNREKLGDGGDTLSPDYFEPAWTKLGLDVNDMDDMVAEIDEEARKSEILMSFV